MRVITPSVDDVDLFDAVVLFACLAKSEQRFEYNVDVTTVTPEDFRVPDYFYTRDGCLVISFDGAWYPFLDNTQGYNRPPLRWYIPKKSALLAEIATQMQTPEHRRKPDHRPGGRVFVHGGGVFRRLPSGEEVPLASWTLPKQSLFVRERRR